MKFSLFLDRFLVLIEIKQKIEDYCFIQKTKTIYGEIVLFVIEIFEKKFYI